MKIDYSTLISNSIHIFDKQIKQTIDLLESGATIPFISRYRKEMTGGLNEVQISDIKDSLEKFQSIESRKEFVRNAIDKAGKLTDELVKRLESTWDSDEIEDIYLPFKAKRTTRAAQARKNGLEPLAKVLLAQNRTSLQNVTDSFVKNEVKTGKEALQGAKDIIAEWVSENAKVRNSVRRAFQQAIISSTVISGKEEEGNKYANYFQFKEKLSRCQSHRILAVLRAKEEGILRVGITPANEESCLDALYKIYHKQDNVCWDEVKAAIDDAYKRLLRPSIEAEVLRDYKLKADEEAIKVFITNLRQLLLAPPLGQCRVLGIDPGFRTGCKLVCLDSQGNLLHNETIYPHPPKNERKQATLKIQHLVETYGIDAIAIGNGTAGRETELFITNIRYPHLVKVFVVSEDGASIYSASALARAEFPQYDVTVRGAVSIGRRLMDPLAELVKIDPKSIGVGQYQHTVDQTLLKKSLDQTVESCVNSVGVNVNTASKELLAYVSGVGPSLAANIVRYRTENGPFKTRSELKHVPRLGEKAFEQCAGFLRIQGGSNPLDNSAVHPERYPIVRQMAKDLNCTVEDLIRDKKLKQQLDLSKYMSTSVGMPTLQDIMDELDKPGRDPRNKIEEFSFNQDVHTLDDLQDGMVLPGIVTNITNFGCFVDIGIKENGLVHISEISDRYISNPAEIVSMHQHVLVRILQVNKKNKRIQLSMKGIEQ